MKPHVYALLWTNISIFILTRSYFSDRFTFKNVVALGITLGMVVGSVLTYALFAIMVWVGLFYFANKGKLKYANLVIIPIIAIVVYFLVNPYVILNYDAFVLETTAQQSWFFIGSDLKYLWLFLVNSLLPGFGVGIVMLLLYIVVFFIFNPPVIGARLIASSLLLVVLFISSISASVSDWHINSRYVFYLVPIILVLYAIYQESSIKILSTILFFTLLQMFPLLLAHYDEDSSEYSTRLQAAEWINNNIPNDKSVCTSGRSIAPYDSPPFNFMRVNVDYEKCDFLISIDRQSDHVVDDPNEELMIRFEPRFNIKNIPLVYSHINPQISIYKK
jgi:MFS family permease